MEIEYVPVLVVLRDLYARPRDASRFGAYLDAMLQGTGDVVLPIAAANPMAREHALARVVELLDLGAEALGASAAADAAARLTDVDDRLRASLVLADDVAGGWTNRYLTEASGRFADRVDRKRNAVAALLWASESPAPDRIRQTLLGDLYRAAYRRRLGPARTLRAMLAQEGRTAAFAGARPALPPAQTAAARATIAPFLDSATYSQQFAALYGDAPAVSVGYVPLGLPARAGFEVALEDALSGGEDPVAALLGTPPA